MSYHKASCDLPRHRLGRWSNRLWICGCGQAWRTRLHGVYDMSWWEWEKWPEGEQDG